MRGIRSRKRWLALVPALAVAAVVVSAAYGAGGVQVSVGYADSTNASPVNFPTPWDGSPGVTYEGCSPSSSCTFNSGAVRVVNNSAGTVHVDDVKVHVDTCTYDLWGATMPVTVAPGHQLIVTQTATGGAGGCTTDGHMDTSNVGPGGANWSGVCTPDGIIPTVDVTIDGVTSTSADTGQVLNTGGVDGGSCAHGSRPAGNESTQWTPIGSQACAVGATLTLAPPTQTHTVGDIATGTATFASCGQPLQGASVTFKVASGPNAGTTTTGVTDGNGLASFSYSSSGAGTDTLQAGISNLAGTITSSTVNVIWNSSASMLGQKLVTDTDHLKPGSALADKAAAIQAAVNANDPVTACAAIANYLGLVKAQTGKKLNSTQASLLTGDANNLAAALGC